MYSFYICILHTPGSRSFLLQSGLKFISSSSCLVKSSPENILIRILIPYVPLVKAHCKESSFVHEGLVFNSVENGLGCSALFLSSAKFSLLWKRYSLTLWKWSRRRPRSSGPHGSSHVACCLWSRPVCEVERTITLLLHRSGAWML